MKKHHAISHMNAALGYAKTLSHSKRKQVACLIVQDDNQPVSLGINGSYPGDSNVLEDENGNTREDTYHAEENAIAKLAGSHASARGALAFVTLEPCLRCARLMARSKVAGVYYNESYPRLNNAGINFLRDHGIPVTQLDVDNIEQFKNNNNKGNSTWKKLSVNQIFKTVKHFITHQALTGINKITKRK